LAALDVGECVQEWIDNANGRHGRDSLASAGQADVLATHQPLACYHRSDCDVKTISEDDILGGDQFAKDRYIYF
jgi:hypothetical protein